MMIRLIHRLKGHTQTINKTITTSSFDMFSKGWLIKCSCGERWAK